MDYKQFAERYADRNWDDTTMRSKFERMMEQLTPLEILQAIPLFPEVGGMGSSSGSGSSSGGGPYAPGEGWAQWNETNWASINLPWSQLN